MDAARREAGLGSCNLEAALSRALLEPARMPPDRLEAATLIDAALRRMDGRLAVLQMKDRQTSSAEKLRAWGAWITKALAAIATGDATAPGPRPTLQGLDADVVDGLTRIARQIDLVARARRQL